MFEGRTGGDLRPKWGPVLASPNQSCHHVDVPTPDLQRLAERVKKRRLDLNLALKRAAAAAGMSKDTWIRVEAGLVVRPQTYDKIEDVLRWTTGSCRKILEGGEPVEIDPYIDEAAVEYRHVPTEMLGNEIRQAIQGSMVAGTDLTADKIREVSERAIEVLRERGLLPPAK